MAATSTVSPYVLLTRTPLFWTGNGITGRGLYADTPPMAMTFFRWSKPQPWGPIERE